MDLDINKYIPSENEFKKDYNDLLELAKKVIINYPNSCFVRNAGGVNECIDECKDIENYWDMECLLNNLLGCFEDEDLPSCGCGSPENVRLVIYKLLKCHSDLKTSDEKLKEILPSMNGNAMIDGLYQFTLHSLEKSGFTSHGFSIYSSTLTEIGKLYLSLCELYYKYEDLDDIVKLKKEDDK